MQMALGASRYRQEKLLECCLINKNGKDGEIQLLFNNTMLPMVKEFKFLDLFCDKKNSYTKHVSELIVRCKSELHLTGIIIRERLGEFQRNSAKNISYIDKADTIRPI